MGTQRILDSEVWCPMSGFKLKEGVVEPHKLSLMECSDGSLYARCIRHTAKIFIQDAVTIFKVMEVSIVVREKQKRPRKEIPHGST